MSAGVARTVPEGCHLGFPLNDPCRRLMQSKREHKARLYGGARCGSACVYAIVGASTRHVDAGATLRIHSSVGPEVDKAESFLRRYVLGMGVDPALVDAATQVPSRSFRGLSRGEMERFGIETRGVHGTPWFAYNGPAEFLLLKSVTYPTGNTGDEYRTGTIGLTCGPFHPSNDSYTARNSPPAKVAPPPRIRVKIGDSLIDLITLNAQKGVAETSFDLDRRQFADRDWHRKLRDHGTLRSIRDQKAITCREVFDFRIIG
jgi:hypothetical protein